MGEVQSANLADSAGQPWAGRHFQQNSSAGDDGSAPEALMQAISRFHAGQAGQSEVVDAVRESRLLIPLLAELGEAGHNAHGKRVDKSQELSIVTVTGPDGRKALPAFSCVATMSAWNPKARPVPATGVRAALAAASEETDRIVLDATSPTEFAIRRPALWAMAQQKPWTPSFQSAEVEAEFAATVADEAAVVGMDLAAGDPTARLLGPELVVGLALVDGLDGPAVQSVLSRLATAWAASTIIADQVDSLEVKLLRARTAG